MFAIHTTILSIAAASLLALVEALPAVSQTDERNRVDLKLGLLVDVSDSVDAHRFDLQRGGYFDALQNRDVIRAIQSGPYGAIAVTMIQWSGKSEQMQVVPWRRLDDAASAKKFADEIQNAPRAFSKSDTSISGAIDFAVELFDHTEFKSYRNVIDVSGDGDSNSGRDVRLSRDEALQKKFVINGLPILGAPSTKWPIDLPEYFKNYVIGGPGAFVVIAKDYESFPDAIYRKLLVEIASKKNPVYALLRSR